MGTIHVDVWLYGPLARYGGGDNDIFTRLDVVLDAGATVSALLARLAMPTEARGITFINGNLSAMPGLQPDLAHVLADGDRVAFFHLKSMWPCQYRHDAAMVDDLKDEMTHRSDQGLRSRFDS